MDLLLRRFVFDRETARSVLKLIERYVLRSSATAFLAALSVLTAIIWLTTALRQFNLLTLQGQSLLIFFAVTGLVIPSLIMVIAPIALFIAVMYTLNRLNSDSELIVMSAAGLSPGGLMRPFAVLFFGAGLLVAAMSLYLMPWGFRELRDLVSQVRADFITHIVREGAFTDLEQGFTFHYRERGPDGSLRGLFIQDRRDPSHVVTYLAERGATEQVGEESLLVLDDGSLQREDAKSANSAIVVFKSYQIDLSQFASGAGKAPLLPRERSTLSLVRLDHKDPYVQSQEGRFRQELVDRFVNPLYAFAFGMVAVAALAQAKTTRQGRSKVMLAAVVLVLLMRVLGFAASNLMVRAAWAADLAVAIPVLTIVGATLYMFGPSRPLPALRRPWSFAGAAPAA